MTIKEAMRLLSMIDWKAHRERVEAHMEKVVEAHRLAATKARAHARDQVLL